MALRKLCKHAKGLSGDEKLAAWKACGCQWAIDQTVNGHRSFLPVGSDYTIARREHDKRALARELGVEMPNANLHPSAYGFTRVARRWWEIAEPALAPNTIAGYQGSLAHAERLLGDGDIRRITPVVLSEMEAVMLRGRWAAGTVANVRGVVRQVLKFAKADGLIDEVPAPLQIRAVKFDEPQVLSPEQVTAVLAELIQPYRDMSEFAYLTGLRAGEVLALEREHVDGMRLVVSQNLITRTGQIGPTKARNVRVVDLSPDAARLLPDVDGLLFTPHYRTWLAHWHDATAIAIGKRLGLHSLRHSNVALRLAAGQTITYVARQLGHQTAAYTLRRYGRWIESERDDASKLDALRHRAASGSPQPPSER